MHEFLSLYVYDESHEISGIRRNRIYQIHGWCSTDKFEFKDKQMKNKINNTGSGHSIRSVNRDNHRIYNSLLSSVKVVCYFIILNWTYVVK